MAQEFSQILRERRPEMLDGWLKETSTTSSPELGNFAESLRVDHDAVQAALLRPWSNGQAEG